MGRKRTAQSTCLHLWYFQSQDFKNTNWRTEFMTVLYRPADPSGRRSKAWVRRSLACWDCGFESRRGHGCLSVVSVVCCQVEVSASGWSLVQRSPTDCGVSECDHEALKMRRPWPTGGCCDLKKIIILIKGLEPTSNFFVTVISALLVTTVQRVFPPVSSVQCTDKNIVLNARGNIK